MAKLRFISDPGHGWLEVELAELERLQIAGQISGYSYLSKDGKFAYLEEDSDAGVFITAKKGRGEPVEYIESHEENTFIRNLPGYNIGLGGKRW